MKKIFFILLLLVTVVKGNGQVKKNNTGAVPTGECEDPHIADLNPVSQTVCPQGTLIFTAMGFGEVLNKVWQLSTDTGATWNNIDSTYKAVTSTSPDSLIIPDVTSNMNNYEYRCQYGWLCGSANSYPAILTVNTNFTWQGVDTNWNNPANWSCNEMPDSTIDIHIPAGMTNYPVIDSIVYCKSITEDPGASVTINAGGNIIITGH